MAIRAATPDDVPAILGLVRELAVYEREPDAVKATEAHVRSALFPDDGAPTTFAHVADVDGEVVGMAVWYLTYSTWTGVNGIWLEDLFVQPPHRGSGLGRELLSTLARTCVDRGYQRLEWSVLDWNEPSLAFYRSLGAVPLDEWTVHRLSGSALSALGDR
jgi:GNAT superfamily N-acetyltransferase